MDRIKSVIVPLGTPVVVDGTTYTELTFRRMKARDTLAGEGETDQIVAGYKLFAVLADVPLDVILELDIEDLGEIGGKVAPLMGKQAVAALKQEMAKQ